MVACPVCECNCMYNSRRHSTSYLANPFPQPDDLNPVRFRQTEATDDRDRVPAPSVSPDIVPSPSLDHHAPVVLFSLTDCTWVGTGDGSASSISASTPYSNLTYQSPRCDSPWSAWTRRGTFRRPRPSLLLFRYGPYRRRVGLAGTVVIFPPSISSSMSV